VLEVDTLEIGQQIPDLLKHDGREKQFSVKSEKKSLLLGSSHGKGIVPMLRENVGNKYEVISILNNIPFLQMWLET
jgi:hypothetical protein